MSSFIRNIIKITEKQKAFIVNTEEDNTSSLAHYLPNGKLYQAKNIENTNLRKSLAALALELIRKETAIKTVADQYYPFTTTDLLERWEQALRIPDDCFKVDGVSLDQRQRQVIAKLAIDNIINKDDFIALAAFFGYIITIDYGFDASVFPAVFPIILGGSPKEEKFTMVVTFYGVEPPTGFPYTFDFVFEDDVETQFLECLIRKLSPANVHVIFRYEPFT